MLPGNQIKKTHAERVHVFFIIFTYLIAFHANFPFPFWMGACLFVFILWVYGSHFAIHEIQADEMRRRHHVCLWGFSVKCGRVSEAKVEKRVWAREGWQRTIYTNHINGFEYILYTLYLCYFYWHDSFFIFSFISSIFSVLVLLNGKHVRCGSTLFLIIVKFHICVYQPNTFMLLYLVNRIWMIAWNRMCMVTKLDNEIEGEKDKCKHVAFLCVFTLSLYRWP